MKTKKYSRLALLLPLVALVLTACPKSPEERVAKLRSYYKARVVGFIVDAAPVPTEPLDDPDSEIPMSAGEVADPGEGDSMEAVAATVPMRQDVRIDILLQHDSPEKLAGITLDLEMVDSQEVLKSSWKVWVDTSELPKATGVQFMHVLEDIDYVEGDGFGVEVRLPVPLEERGEYREFSVPAGS